MRGRREGSKSSASVSPNLHAPLQTHTRIRRRAFRRLAEAGERSLGAGGAGGRDLRHDRRARGRAWRGPHGCGRACDGAGRACRPFARVDAVQTFGRAQRPSRPARRRRAQGGSCDRRLRRSPRRCRARVSLSRHEPSRAACARPRPGVAREAAPRRRGDGGSGEGSHWPARLLHLPRFAMPGLVAHAHARPTRCQARATSSSSRSAPAPF